MLCFKKSLSTNTSKIKKKTESETKHHLPIKHVRSFTSNKNFNSNGKKLVRRPTPNKFHF